MSKLVVRPNGRIEFIYQDDLRGLLAEGHATITRASHVEPTVDSRWAADMTPVDGPPCLGPFDTRAEALAAEVAWLEQHVL
jgi:hypothetical protein